jgi:hypothetical protein
MQRFFTLLALLFIALPFGLSTTGCVTNVAAYCNNAGYGPRTTDIYNVALPALQSATGISLAYGQIGQVGTAVATTCKGNTVSTGAATYGSSNLSLADISPTGSVCGGTWNRLSEGGIPDFTICTPPTAPGTATVTASVGGISSNPVTIYVHPQVSAITILTPQDCFSSGATKTSTFVQDTQVFDENGALISPQYTGTVTYVANTPSIVTINNTSVNAASSTTDTITTPNGTATANQPGGTVITATIAGTGSNSVGTSSAAGYFYTCPPTNIALTLPNSNGGTTGTGTTTTNGVITVTNGNPQSITAVLTDKNNTAITPLAGNGPDYTSTEPLQIGVSTAGLVTPALPGSATISGICQPGAATTSTNTTSSTSGTATGQSCNPTPLNVLGTFGTGLPIVANSIQVETPGVDNTQLWAASPDSQQFTPFDLSLSSGGSPVLLPYPPNSMVLSPTGTSLFFGSKREIMIYSTTTNALQTQDVTVPGVVLAVSPAGNQVVIADQLRQVIYLYTPATNSTTSGSTSTTAASVISIGGVATHAVYSQDGKNVYVVGPSTLYIHNVVSGWSQYPLTNANATTTCALDNTGINPFCSPDIALTVPSEAVFITGTAVNARSFCPDTSTSPVTYNPVAGTVAGAAADHLAATDDGNHVLGANTTQLFDIEHAPTSDASQQIAPIGPCPGVNTAPGALPINTTLQQLALTNITPSQIDQVLTSPDSSKAFITYTASAASGLLPLYTPSTTAGAVGTLSNIQLSTGALDPIAGAFSPDATQFFVSTTGDNLIHIVNTTTLKDTQQLNPQLLNPSGQQVPAQFIVTKPRATT